jgi:hypothetical protein
MPTDCLHLLTIDFEGAPARVRDSFAFSNEELSALLSAAGRERIPLALVPSARALHLVSTSQNHVRAFRPALALLHERTHALAGARTMPVQITRGGDAARQFLRHATPFSQPEADARAFVLELRAAAALSEACGAFSSELGALFRMTEQAAERVRRETRLGRPGSLEAELELEALDAQRIVEEEILAWQSSSPTLRASIRPPVSDHDIELFAAEEPQSVMRLRASGVLRKLRTA